MQYKKISANIRRDLTILLEEFNHLPHSYLFDEKLNDQIYKYPVQALMNCQIHLEGQSGLEPLVKSFIQYCIQHSPDLNN